VAVSDRAISYGRRLAPALGAAQEFQLARLRSAPPRAMRQRAPTTGTDKASSGSTTITAN
jgi:hypothetical protein